MIAIAVDAAKEATCERSRPRPITTTAMPSARMPRIEILRARAKKFPRLRKPFKKTEKRTIRIAHMAKTAHVSSQFFIILFGKNQADRIQKSRDVSETPPFKPK